MLEMMGASKTSDHIPILLFETARYDTIKEPLYHWVTSDGGREWFDSTTKVFPVRSSLLQDALLSFTRILFSRQITWDNRGQGPVQVFRLPLEENEWDNQAVCPLGVLRYVPRSAF